MRIKASADNSDSDPLDDPFPPRSALVPIPGWLVGDSATSNIPRIAYSIRQLDS